MWGPFAHFFIFCKRHSRRIIKGSPEPNAGGEKTHDCSTNHLMNTDDPSRNGIIHFLQAFHWPWKEKPNRNQAHSRSFPERLGSDLYACALLYAHITGEYSGRWFVFLAASESSKQLMSEKKKCLYIFLEIQCKLIVAARSGVGMHSAHACIEWMLFSLRTSVAKWTLPLNYSIWGAVGAISAPVNRCPFREENLWTNIV